MKNSFLIMTNWAVALKGLPEHTTSELIKMICEYQIDETIRDSDDMTAVAIFNSWKPRIDENNRLYEERCIKRSEAGKKGMASRWKGHNKAITNNNNVITNDNKTITNDSKRITNDNDTDTDTDTDSNNITPLTPLKGETPEATIDDSSLSDPVKAMLKEWVQYKRERREGYKPAGLKSLITTATRYEKSAGADAVCEVIRKSMSSGYKGIVWDRLDGKAPAKGNKFNEFPQNQYDYDELERTLIQN